jgi:hypothetical protein
VVGRGLGIGLCAGNKTFHACVTLGGYRWGESGSHKKGIHKLYDITVSLHAWNK